MIASILSFLSGGKGWLAAIALGAIAAFAAGWYTGSTHEAKIMAKAAVTVADQARKEQASKDALDWAAAKADYDKRHEADAKASEKLRELSVRKHVLVPNPEKAVVSAEAMKALNDPALIGSDAVADGEDE